MGKQSRKERAKPVKQAKPPTRPRTKKTGDQITAENIGEQSVVTQGRNARSYVLRMGNITIDLRLFPVVVILLIIIIALVYMLVPRRPSAMKGEFNVAVAEFVTLDDRGEVVRSEDGRNLSDFLYQRLKANFSELDVRTVRYEIWPPEYTGVIRGATEQERWNQAELMADPENGINADVIIYGVFTKAEPGADFADLTLEFYVNYKGFEEADEITGEHRMGKPVHLALPFREDELIDITNRVLSERTNALGLVAIGLAYYSIDDYERAIEYFKRAEETKGWLPRDGKEVAYLLLGNAATRLASRDYTVDGLTNALAFYDQALGINDKYARAIVGRANVLYLLAIGDPDSAEQQDVDPSKLKEVEEEFNQAWAAKEVPDHASIGSKVNFGLGQVFLIRYLTGQGDDWHQQAREKFDLVVQDYDSGNWRIPDLAGHAHARLALLASLGQDTTQAIDEYHKAIALVTPYYQAYYYTRIGKLYAQSQQTGAAIDAYQQAVYIAESHADLESSARYGLCLQELQTKSTLESCDSR